MIDVPPEPFPYQEQVIEQRLIDCGLNTDGITVQYEDYLQSIEIVIAPSAGATWDDFECIRKATGYEIVMFQDETMLTAYTDFTSEQARPEMIAMYEGRLKEAGLWESFPDRQDFNSLPDYVEALEKHAGIEPGSALRVSGNGVIFDPPKASVDDADFVEKYSDLFAVIAYASAKDRLQFGFIGNERAPE